MLWVWENRSILLHFSGLSLLHIPCQWTNKLILSCHIHFNTPIIIFSPFTRICICHFYNVTVYSIMTDDLRERSYPTVYFHCKKFSKTSTHYEKLEKKYNTSRAICWFFFFFCGCAPFGISVRTILNGLEEQTQFKMIELLLYPPLAFFLVMTRSFLPNGWLKR